LLRTDALILDFLERMSMQRKNPRAAVSSEDGTRGLGGMRAFSRYKQATPCFL